MRAPKKPQSAFRTPLNRIFGTEANIRLLRVMSLGSEALSRTELGRRADLETKGAHLAANRLEEEGLFIRVGSGVRQQLTYNTEHPLAAVIRGLFLAEKQRIDLLLESLRSVVEGEARIDAAWLQGPFATEADQPGDPIVIGVLAKGDVLSEIVDSLQKQVAELEARYDATLEVRGFTRADLATASESELEALLNAKSLWGPGPMTFLHGAQSSVLRSTVSHASRDAEAAILAAEIAQRILRQPELRTKAAEWVTKRLQSASLQERRELEEWETLLRTSSPSRLSRFLRDEGERATRLRQTLPFLQLLSEDERAKILRKAREK